MIRHIDIWPPKAKTGYFYAPSVAGYFFVTGLGFRPRSVTFFIDRQNNLMSLWFTYGHGFADYQGNQNCSGWTGKSNNQFRGDSRINKCLLAFNEAGVTQVEATMAAMPDPLDDYAFVLNFTTTNNIFKIRWLAAG